VLVVIAALLAFVNHFVSRNASIDCTRSGTTLSCREDESELGFRRSARSVQITDASGATAAPSPARDGFIVSVERGDAVTPLTTVSTADQGDAAFVAGEVERLLSGKSARAQSGYTYTGSRELAVVLAVVTLLLAGVFAWELSRRGTLSIDPARGRARIPRSRTRRHDESVELDQVRGFGVEQRGAGARVVLETSAGTALPLTDSFYFGKRRQRAIASELAELLAVNAGREARAPSDAVSSSWRDALQDAAALVPVAAYMALIWSAEALPQNENTGWVLQLAFTVPVVVLLLGALFVVHSKFLRGAKHGALVGQAGLYAALLAPVAGWRSVRLLNVGLDASQGVPHASQFVRHVSRSKGSDQIEIADWRNPSDTLKLDASWLPYQQQIAGRALRVTTHTGRLGIEWVSRVETDQ
jgi:hypothetical protein